VPEAARLAAGLVRADVLAGDDPPGFLHPVIRDAVEASLASDERDACHRAAARLLHADGAPAGQVAAHLVRLRPARRPLGGGAPARGRSRGGRCAAPRPRRCWRARWPSRRRPASAPASCARRRGPR
jgi:hypothetical protein